MQISGNVFLVQIQVPFELHIIENIKILLRSKVITT